MDWARTIEINKLALTRIVAELFAMLGVMGGPAMERLLRPTESAIRRLIVIAARGLYVKVLPKGIMPRGLKIEGTARGRTSFRLYDARQRFAFIQPSNPDVVMVKTYTSNPFNMFDKMYTPRAAKLEKENHFQQRLEAARYALEHLNTQARRMVRWMARRKLLEKPKFTSPLRAGAAPGARKTQMADIDYVLSECHYFAWEALKEDTS